MNSNLEPSVRHSRLRAALPGITAGVLIAIILYPAGRAVVAEQLLSLTPVTSRYSQWVGAQTGHYAVAILLERLHQPASQRVGTQTGHYAGLSGSLNLTAKREPSDATLQVGALLATHPDAHRNLVIGLRAIEASHPDSALAAAAALNFELGELAVARYTNAAVTLDQSGPSGMSFGDTGSVPPATLLADATHGAALEPDNGYFIFVQAIALMQLYRDADALRALAAAAAAPNFNDHLREMIAATDAACLRAEPNLLGITRDAIAAGALFPQFGSWRAMARLIRVRIYQADARGDFARAVTLRLQLIHLAAGIRIHASNIISALVAIAIAGIAEIPPTSYLPQNYHRLPTATRIAVEVAASNTYFARHASPADVTWIAKDRADCAAYRAAVQKVLTPSSGLILDTVQMMALMVVGEVLLLASLLLAAAGAFAAVVLPAVNRRARWGVAPETRYALTFGIGLGLLAALAACSDAYRVFGCCALGAALAVALALPALPFRLRLRALTISLIPLVATAVAAIGLHSIAGSGSMLGSLTDMYSGYGFKPGLGRAAAVAIAAGPLLLVLAIIAGVTIWCRVPFILGMVRGIRGVAPAVCCAVLLLYAAETVVTLQSNRRINQVMDHNLYHPTTAAQLRAAGKRPGAVPRDIYL